MYKVKHISSHKFLLSALHTVSYRSIILHYDINRFIMLHIADFERFSMILFHLHFVPLHKVWCHCYD